MGMAAWSRKRCPHGDRSGRTPWVTERLLGQVPPAPVRRVELVVLMRVFAHAFGVVPPSLARHSPEVGLLLFREFTAACMEMACESGELASLMRRRLGAGARRLGDRIRRLPGTRSLSSVALASYLYRGIGISLTGELPGELRFGPCFFAGRYTPQDCWLMSAFDEGFLQGLCARPGCTLTFSCRLTQGASCCVARFDDS